MPPILMWVLVVVAAAVCGALGYYFGGENRKRTAEAKIGSAEEEAKRIVNDAIKAAEQKRKETIIEAKDEAFKLKADADKEIKDRRAEISRQERRMDQKEEALDKRTAAMERKEEDLKKRGELVEARLDELEQLKLRQTEKLETIAAMTQEDARAVLLKNIDDELTKPRPGYRPLGLSYSAQGTYKGEEFLDAEQITKNKLCIYTREKNTGFDRRFLMKRVGEGWMIDAVQERLNGWQRSEL